MASIVRQISASTDDCYRCVFTDSWSIASNGQWVGYETAILYALGGGMRFTNVTIPQGATINEAHLTFRPLYPDAGVEVKSRISAEDVDNAVTFADDAAAFDARYATKTTAVVDWDNIPAWLAGVDYDSSNVKTVIQEIVNRPGWASGNAIVIFWEDFEDRSTHVNEGQRVARSYNNSTTLCPKLTIDWGAIDIGSPAIDRTSAYGGGTFIALENTANGTGYLTSIEIWASTDITGLRVGTFYWTVATAYQCRDSAYIGDVTAGSKQTFPVYIAVSAGDCIGCYVGTGCGTIESNIVGYAGVYFADADYLNPGDIASYALLAGDTISLYGSSSDGLFIHVDWDNDGNFNDTIEDISGEVKQFFIEAGRDTDLDKAMVGQAGIIVTDTNGKYVPENTTSVLYGSLLPGRAVRIQRVLNGATYELFNGFLDDVLPDPSRYVLEAYLPCVDGLDQLSRIPISMALQTSKESGELIDTALDKAGWSATKRLLDTGQDTYPLVHAESISCKGFKENLEASEFSFGYIGHDGYFQWEDRLHRLGDTHIVPSWVCTNLLFRDIKPTKSLKSVRNKISITAQPKSIAAGLTDIWTLQENSATSDSPLILAGETKTYWAEFMDANGMANIAGSVITPASTTDYQGNNAIDGSAASRTTDVSVTAGIFAGSAKLEVENIGASSLYLTLLKIQGKIYTDQPRVKCIAESTASGDKYQFRERTIDMPYYQSVGTMQNFADYRLGVEKEPWSGYRVELVNMTDTVFAQELARHISDRITLQDSRYAIDDDFYIDKIRHEWRAQDKIHHCWWTLSKCNDQMFWIWDTSTWDFSTRWAY